MVGSGKNVAFIAYTEKLSRRVYSFILRKGQKTGPNIARSLVLLIKAFKLDFPESTLKSIGFDHEKAMESFEVSNVLKRTDNQGAEDTST